MDFVPLALCPVGRSVCAGSALPGRRLAGCRAARARAGRAVRRQPGAAQCHHRRGGGAGGTYHADFGFGQAQGRPGTHSHRGHRGAAARPRIPVGSGVRGMVLAEWQRRDDRHRVGRGVRLPRRTCDDHQHPQRGCGSRRHHSMADRTRCSRCQRLFLVAPGGRRNLGRLVERRQRLSRQAGARIPRARYRARGPGGGRQRRRRHRYDLQRLQRRHRHRVAAAGRQAGRLHHRRAGAMQLRISRQFANCRHQRRARDTGPGALYIHPLGHHGARLDHRRRGDRCTAPAAPAQAAHPPRDIGLGPKWQHFGQRVRRHLHCVLYRQFRRCRRSACGAAPDAAERFSRPGVPRYRQATDESIVNAIVASHYMVGADDHRVSRFRMRAARVLKKYDRLSP